MNSRVHLLRCSPVVVLVLSCMEHIIQEVIDGPLISRGHVGPLIVVYCNHSRLHIFLYCDHCRSLIQSRIEEIVCFPTRLASYSLCTTRIKFFLKYIYGLELLVVVIIKIYKKYLLKK